MDAAPTSAEPAWRDLALNRPGALARQRAIEERERAPFKTTLARVLRVHTDERAWRVGADGEAVVGRRLARLPLPWRTLHSIPVGSGSADIDHLVIGPGGVFTINTKHHAGKAVWVSERALMVDGYRTDYLRNSRHEAERARKLLCAAWATEVRVEPLIVVIARALTIKGRLETVAVVTPKQVVNQLHRRPARLPPDAVAQIYEYARRSTTWTRAVSARR